MKEEIEGDSCIEQHTAGANNAEGRDTQHPVQDKEDDQGSVDINKENRQDRKNKTFPYQTRHTESDHELITEHISK